MSVCLFHFSHDVVSLFSIYEFDCLSQYRQRDYKVTVIHYDIIATKVEMFAQKLSNTNKYIILGNA